MSLNRTRFIHPLLSCALAAAAAAQGSNHFGGKIYELTWPGVSASFGRSVSGDFDGDGLPDVVQMAGSAVVLAFGPGEYDSIADIGRSFNDVDVLPARGADKADGLVAVDASGLTHATFHSPAGAFLFQDIADPVWAGAALVRAAELDNVEGPDVFGASQDRSTLLLRCGDFPANAETSEYPLLGSLIDALALDWDGVAGREIAVLSDYGIEIYSPSGARLFATPSIAPGGALAVLDEPDTQHDRLVWITNIALPDAQWMIVLDKGVLAEFVDLGPLGTSAVTVTDYDGNGFPDLALSHRYSHELLLMISHKDPSNPGTKAFTGSIDQLLLFQVGPQAGAPAPGNFAKPAWSDFDNDGDTDMLFATESTGRVQIYLGETVDAETQRTVVLGAEFGPATNDSELRFDLGEPADFPAGATHVRVDVWHQDAFNVPFDQLGLGQIDEPITGAWPLRVVVPIPEESAGFVDVYGVQLRFVELDGPVLVARGPTLSGAFNMTDGVVEDIEELPGSGVVYEVTGISPFDDPGGGFVTRPNNGPFTGNPPRR